VKCRSPYYYQSTVMRVSLQMLASSNSSFDKCCAHRSRCGAGTEANDDQSDCVACGAGWAASTGVCQICDAGKTPVTDGSRCEVCLSRVPLLLSVQAMSHVSPWPHVCIDGRLLGVSRYVQLASSRTTTRATACSALLVKPPTQATAVHVALARLQTMIRPAACFVILGSNRSKIMTCALNALQGRPLQYRTLESASSAPQA
jgi:hypothetical protein